MYTRERCAAARAARSTALMGVLLDARRGARRLADARATRTCSAPSRCTSATTCWPTSGCSRATASRFAFAAARGGPAAARRRRARGRELRHRPPHGGRELGLRRGRRRTRSTRCPDRDFVLDYLGAAATCATHLSRLGAELVLWSSQEFGFCRAARRVELGLVDHAAEEEPGRGRAAARQGAARRRAPGGAARRDARPAAHLQQGPAGGQGAPVRRRRHARAGARRGRRECSRACASTASGWPRRRPTS